MNDFNEAMFKTKVDNIFVKIYTAIMKQDLSSVEHFLSDSLKEKFNLEIENVKNRNQRHIYDEINVKDTQILHREIIEDKEIVTVEIISRYMDYVMDDETGDTLYGDDTRRIEKKNILKFEKNVNAKDIGLVRKCPGCGASISVNTTGKCEYCGTIFNQKDYDYILVDMKVV